MRMNPDFGYHASSSHNLNSTGETIDLVFIWPNRVVQHYSQSSGGSRTFPPGFRVSRYIQKCVWIPISSNTAQFCRISNFRSKDLGSEHEPQYFLWEPPILWLKIDRRWINCTQNCWETLVWRYDGDSDALSRELPVSRIKFIIIN